MNDSTVLCLASADSAFGPVVEGCRDGFDFTFAFEQYFFAIAPSVILLLLAPLRLLSLRGKRRRVGGNGFRIVKLGTIAVFAIVQLTLLVLWATDSQALRDASIVAAAFSFVDSVVFCLLSYKEHSRSLRPSVLLNTYLLASSLFDAVRLRTLWLMPYNSIIRVVFTTSFALKVVILLLEAREKRIYLNETDRQRGPEETSGLFSQSLFWWLNSVIRKGFRQILIVDDLYPIDKELSSEELGARFWKAWNSSSRQGKHQLVLVLISMLKWPILMPILPRLVLIAFTFCQPLLVNRFLNYLQDSSHSQDANIGYGLIGAYGLVYFGMAISSGFYWHRTYRCITMLRGTLVTAVFGKTLDISITALDNSKAVTLMSTDVERVVRGLREVHELWANVVQIALGTWLLEREIGAACVAPVLVAAASTGLMMWLSSLTKERQLVWVKKIEKRVGITSTMLGYMKSIKMAGLTQKLLNLIGNLRIEEIKSAKAYRRLGVYTSTLAYVPLMLSPVVTFAFFTIVAARTNTTLDATRLFTSLSLLLLLLQPLFYVFAGLMDLMSSLGCFDRIEQFLLADSRTDHRLMTRMSSESLNSYGGARPAAGNEDDIELVNLRTTPSTSANRLSAVSEIIGVRDGCFGWTREGEPILRDINLSIQRGQLILLIGPVGSGKSTLLMALLGETPNSKGFVHLSTSRLAWSEQTPWLINASVRRNIIGFARFDSDLYDSVIHACNLADDIASFPDGDQSMVGSKGITLSGGQKARLAIARAIYSKPDIAIFDDVFSGLDVKTEAAVFDGVYGRQGLLRRWGTTVVVATHAVNLLPSADYIVALGSNGMISEQGTFEKLNDANGYVHSFYLKHADDIVDAGATGALTGKVDAGYMRRNKQSDTKSGTSGGKGRQIGDWSVYHYYFQTLGWQYTSVFFVLEILWAFFFSFPTVWLKYWADANTSHPNEQNGLYLGVYTALQVTGLCSSAALVWFCFNIMVMKSGVRLHEIILKTVMSAPMAFFSSTDTGSITTRFSQDIQLIDGQLPLALLCVGAYLFICIAQAILIASATFYVALSFPALIAAYYFLQKYYLRTSRQLRFMDLEEKAPLYTQFLESLSGLATIRAFRWQKDSVELNHQLVDRSQKPFYLLFMVQRWLTLVLDLVTMALAVLVVGCAVKMRDSISIGFTGVALTQIISFTEYLKLMIMFWTQLETSIGAVARIKQFSMEIDNENRPNEREEPPEDWPRRGRIEIEGVSAAYSTESESKALKSISITIEAGQKIGICGRTGSGKSSLILALYRMLELSSGTITIDGLDISTLPRHHIRSRLNAIGQDPFFIAGTVRLNLDPYETAADEALIKALEKVQLWTVIEVKGGLDVDMDIDMLSHGQRQLFSLARAILRPGKIIVLDEVTSSVDRKTDELMQRVIRDEFKDCTIIAIAHRLDTISDFDRILVLDGGAVMEYGSPVQLLNRRSKFRELYDSYQMKKRVDEMRDA